MISKYSPHIYDCLCRILMSQCSQFLCVIDQAQFDLHDKVELLIRVLVLLLTLNASYKLEHMTMDDDRSVKREYEKISGVCIKDLNLYN